MWNDTRDCTPLADGYYLVQTVFGDITGMSYTRKGGWNTRYTFEGELYSVSAVTDTYVARWYDAETPKAVPEEWVDAHMDRFSREGVKE